MLAVFLGGNGHSRPSYGNIQEISCHHVKSGVKLFYSEEEHQGYNEFIEHAEQEVKPVLMVAEECQTMPFSWWVWAIASSGHLGLHIRGKCVFSGCWIEHWRVVLMWFHLLYFSISIFKHLKFWWNMILDTSCIWLDHIMGGYAF